MRTILPDFSMAGAERRLVLEALVHEGCNMTAAAKLLGVSRSKAVRLAQKYGLPVNDLEALEALLAKEPQ